MKEIIIDDVNVWSCKHYDLENNYCDQSYLGEDGLLKNTKNPKRCEQSPNCYFKQLKRLQEENEKLKAKIAKFRWDNPYYDLYNNVVGQRDNLKKENEKLKKKKDEYFVMNLNYEVKISDLTQALEEIKEDLEQDTTCESRECGCDDYGECLKCVKETILDKIKEVLNDRD